MKRKELDERITRLGEAMDEMADAFNELERAHTFLVRHRRLLDEKQHTIKVLEELKAIEEAGGGDRNFHSDYGYRQSAGQTIRVLLKELKK